MAFDMGAEKSVNCYDTAMPLYENVDALEMQCQKYNLIIQLRESTML